MNTLERYIYIKSENAWFWYARGDESVRGKEFHIHHEIALFLGGEAEFITDQIHIKLQPNTLLVIPKETYHQLVLTGEREQYLRCVLSFDDTPELLPLIAQSMWELRVLEADRKTADLFDLLIHSNENDSILLGAALVVLLTMISRNDVQSLKELPQNTTVIDAVRFINEHLCEDLPISRIAQSCYVSPSTLCHLFKKEMNIPIHQFIMKKRLITAYQKISTGKAASAAAAECGFNDYSGFYKRYKKLFGFPPSHT